MKIKRTFDDGSFDHVNVFSIEHAKTKKFKGDKKLKTLQIIDVVSGIVMAIINVLKTIKK